MPYLIDRERALLGRDIVAALNTRGRRIRSHVVLADNSLCRTLTRPRTLAHHLARQPRLSAPWAAFTADAVHETGA